MSRLFLPLAAALFVAACGSSRPAFDAPDAALPGAFPNHSPAEIREAVARGTEAFRGVYAEGDIAVTSPAQNGRFGMRLTAADSGFLYLTVHPGFGIEAARVLVRPDSFFVHNRIENTLQLGPMAAALAALPVPVTADEGFATVTGTLLPPADRDWSLRADTALYYLSSPDGRRVVTVDPALWRVVRTVQYDATGALEEERRFERFADVGGQAFPRRIVIHRPGDRIQATLLYRDLTLDPAEGPPAALSVGAGVRRVVITE